MSLSRALAGLRWFIVAAVTLITLGVIVIAGNQFFTLRARLAEEPAWIRTLWWGGAAVMLIALLYVLYRAFFPRRRANGNTRSVPDEATLRREVDDWADRGVDVGDAARELRELDRRRESGETVVAVYGEVSTGKSSLIRALLPEAEIAVDVRGGTTRSVAHYRWQSPDGAGLTFADMPGFGDLDGLGDAVARDEAARAHLVLFVADGEPTRGQWQALEAATHLGKPLVVAVNKSDRYDAEALAGIRRRITGRLGRAASVVAVRSGGTEEVLRREADGTEHIVERARQPDVRELRRGLQAALDCERGRLERRRDNAIFLMTARKLEGAVQAHRRDAADALVDRYARRAMFGAVAAVAPGSDLVIQGTLAVSLVRELCRLYRVDFREMAMERLVAALRRRTGNATPLLLGVAGNAFKAFPGLGTLAGGAVHAVAYGLLFRNIGAAVAESLERRGELDTEDALSRFEETLRENLEPPARELAALALEDRRADPSPGPSGAGS